MTKSTNLRAEIIHALDSCYSDRPANGYWLIYEHNLDAIIETFQRQLDSIELPEKRKGKLIKHYMGVVNTNTGDYYPESKHEEPNVWDIMYNQAIDDCAAVIKEFREGLK